MTVFSDLDTNKDELKALAERIDRVIDDLDEIEEDYDFEDIKKVVSDAQSNLEEIRSEIY